MISLKTINDDVMKGLLEAEKRSLQQIRSSHVPKIFDIFNDDSYCFICMELIGGSTIEDTVNHYGKF